MYECNPWKKAIPMIMATQKTFISGDFPARSRTTSKTPNFSSPHYADEAEKKKKAAVIGLKLYVHSKRPTLNSFDRIIFHLVSPLLLYNYEGVAAAKKRDIYDGL